MDSFLFNNTEVTSNEITAHLYKTTNIAPCDFFPSFSQFLLTYYFLLKRGKKSSWDFLLHSDSACVGTQAHCSPSLSWSDFMAKEVIAENNRKKEQNYTLLELLPSLAEDKVKPTMKTEGRMRQILKFHGGGGQNKTATTQAKWQVQEPCRNEHLPDNQQAGKDECFKRQFF